MFGKRRFGHDICCHVNEWHEVLPSLLLCFIYDFFGGGEDTASTTLRYKELSKLAFFGGGGDTAPTTLRYKELSKLSRCSVSLHPHPADKKGTRLGHGTVAVLFGMPSGSVRDLVGTQHLPSLPLSIRFIFAFFDAVRTPHLLHKGKFTLPKDFTAQPSGGMDTVIPLSSFLL